MNRRGFLGSILAAAVAPAIVRADSLMRVVPMDGLIFHPHSIDFVCPEVDWFTGAIRELSCYDLLSDAIVVRYDVMGCALDGSPVQEGIDCKLAIGADIEQARGPALELLKRHLDFHHIRPVHGALRIPSDFRADAPYGCNTGRFL